MKFGFHSEADNAIMGLHLKPPLNWEVNYARFNYEVPNHCQRSPSPTMTSERQYSDMGLHSSNSRQSPRYIEMRGTDSSMGMFKSIYSSGSVVHTNRSIV